MVDAQFVITYTGKALDGAAISTFSKSEEDCQHSCMEDDRCKSININDNGTKCELNNKIAGDIETRLVTRDGWKYKTTNFSEKQVYAFHNEHTGMSGTSDILKGIFKVWHRLGLYDEISLTDSFIFTLCDCVDFKAIGYESTSFNRIIANKSYCVTPAILVYLVVPQISFQRVFLV